jgi:hypothetical protein
MQNKPNFQDAQMSVSNIITMNYKNFIPLAGQKNKPNSNPIKPNLQKAKIDAKCVFTKDYRKNDDFAVRKNKPNSKPISSKAKMNANAFSQKDYENETAFRPQKNKPNSNPVLSAIEWANFKRDDGFSAYYTRDYHVAEFTLSAAEGGLANTFLELPCKELLPGLEKRWNYELIGGKIV